MIPVIESLFLLTLDEDEGYIVESTVENLESALAVAVLAELFLRQRIVLKDQRFVVENVHPTDHPVLDKALFEIISAERPHKLSYWVNKLTESNLLNAIGHDLVEQGVLSRHKKRLRMAGGDGSQAGEGSVKYSLTRRLREIVLAGGQPELGDRVLLQLLYHADLLKLVFTVGERRAAAKWVRRQIGVKGTAGEQGEMLEKIVAAVGLAR